jgi:hypothetical protein
MSERIGPRLKGEAALQEPSRIRPAREFDEDIIGLREYLEPIRRRWRLVAAVTVLAIVFTGILTTFAMKKWYRAEAIIRPVTATAVQGRLAGYIGGFGGLGGMEGLGASLLDSEASSPASEYMPILRSFAFTTRLIKQHGIGAHLDAARSHLFGIPRYPEWARYAQMRQRFDCEYSNRTGNLTLYYQDPDRTMATKVLGYYVYDLRELLRAEQIHDASEAINSLRAESGQTADELLQVQLHDLLARQIQQEKLAQVEADFAFKVLQDPTTPVDTYRPQVVLDALLAGMLALLGCSIVLLFRGERF